MKMRIPLSLLALALSTVSVSVGAATPPPQEFPQSAMYGGQEVIQIGGSCEMDVSPDQAIIAGGVSSAAVKPTDAVDQLEKELGLMKAYIAETHGKIEMLERARTLKNPQPGRADTEPPYQIIQRLQITLPADAPMDEIVQKLIELGLDRFGDNVLTDYNRREAVVRYRVSNLDDKLKDFQERCVAEAWRQWCAASSVNGKCESATPPSSLDVQQFTVRSRETLLRPDGNSMPWQFVMTRTQHANPPPDLLGDLTVHLDGYINLIYHREESRP